MESGMVVAVETMERPELTFSQLAEWVDEYVEQGKEPEEAAACVLADLKQDDLAAQLLELCGRRYILDCWRKQQSGYRRAISAEAMGFTQPNVHADDKRVVDIGILQKPKTFMEMPVYVNGEWMVLGDLDRAIVKAASAANAKLAATYAQWELFLKRVADDLPRDKLVREHFTEDQLKGFFRQSAVES